MFWAAVKGAGKNYLPQLRTRVSSWSWHLCADLFLEEITTQIRRAMIAAYILVTDAKHFKNLRLQESRLLHRYGQDAKELKALQVQRRKEQEEPGEQAKQTATPKTLATTNGFEFTVLAKPAELITEAGKEVTGFKIIQPTIRKA